MKPQQWLRYWKKNLLDSMKTDIDLTQSDTVIEIEDFNIKYPKINSTDRVKALIDREEKRINAKRQIKNPEDEKWLTLDSVQVLISPFQLSALPEHGVFTRDKKPFFPFWYYATLTRSGELKVPEETTPLIARKYLSPIAGENIDYTISSVEAIDKASPVEKERFENYPDYINHILGFFKTITGQELYRYQTDFFKTLHIAHITAPQEETGAAIHIVHLYDKLLNLPELPPLLSEFIRLESPAPHPPLLMHKWLSVNARHLGQMQSDFPLSYSQRKGLYTLLDGHDRIFAVNGPPGTGKTTLLQSIVANEMVNSALHREKCPHILLACSANNQAVTNIIDSFTKGNNPKNIRWLPDIEGYATYLPKASKPEDELTGINYLKPDGEGIFTRLETPEYIGKAKEIYLKRANENLGTQHTNPGEVAETLQKQLKESQARLNAATKLWGEYEKAVTIFDHEFRTGFSDLSAATDENGLLNPAFLEHGIARLKQLEEKIIENFRKESSLRRLGCRLKLKRSLNNRKAELRILYRNASLDTDILPASVYDRSELLQQTAHLIGSGKKILTAIGNWQNWKSETGIETNPPLSALKEKTSPSFFDELDIGIRYPAFVDALHYWEACWLDTMEQFLRSDPSEKNKRGLEATRERWHRRAMLTPCFVSTFYMAPKFFTYSKYLGQNDPHNPAFSHEPLLDFIDTLIVDEAGQVPPEIGIANLTLAKRTIIVGDIKQIEPVWNISTKIDLGNLKTENLIKDYDDPVSEKEYLPKGFLSSCGSLMQMAQNACRRKESQCPEKGIILVEHRRCYDEIIRYCNELAYHGILSPLRGKAKNDNLFPPMLCIPVEGKSEIHHNMRWNTMEIEAICQWLTEHREAITRRYAPEGKSGIEDFVGIVTPFVGQKNHLRKALRKCGFDVSRMKVGTIHALQGAERPIILFSMVYGKEHCGTMFFDRDNKPNMLNVAVSRAKDSFIVFAHPEILNPRAHTPSGILARHLVYAQTDTGNHENNLPHTQTGQNT